MIEFPFMSHYNLFILPRLKALIILFFSIISFALSVELLPTLNVRRLGEMRMFSTQQHYVIPLHPFLRLVQSHAQGLKPASWQINVLQISQDQF